MEPALGHGREAFFFEQKEAKNFISLSHAGFGPVFLEKWPYPLSKGQPRA
jgi:hypothetical protein